jgi:RNA-directed DNA polymerase
MVLDGIHDHLQIAFGATKIKEQKVNYVRYADDFIVTANSKEFLENEVKPSIETFLNAKGLRLSQEKTVVTHIQQGFTFLGQTVRKFKDKLIIKPSDKSIKNLLGKIRDICSEHKQATTETIIRKLNPVIRGWAYHHRHVVSSEIYGKVDSEIHKILWRWAKRRHPNKNFGWVKKKYFKANKGRNWVFTSDSDKEGSQLHLFRAAQIKIKRHIKVKQDANPFDPKWEIYYERKELSKFKGKKEGKFLNLPPPDELLCALCKKSILPNSSWEYHFKQPWMHGGQCQGHNLTHAHTECHERLHAR